MSKKKKLLISIFSLALCVLVTFAWINELQNPEGRVMALRLTDAAIADNDLVIKLSVNQEGEIYEDITSVHSDLAEPDLESYTDFAPGSRKKFKVEITNLSESPIALRLLLSDIVCADEELKECIIIGTNGFDGFTADYPAPTVQNQRLSDGLDAGGGFTLVDCVEIPPNNSDKPVSIYFYIMFSAAGSAFLEDMSFSIGTINFVTL